MLALVEFDTAIAQALALWRTESEGLSSALRFVADSHLAKGVALILMALAVVARPGGPLLLARNAFLLRFSAAAVVSLASGRILQIALPHRDRPIVSMSGWAEHSSFAAESSFPSDHAVYFTAMAAAIAFADRRLGMIAIAWTGLIVLLPRVLLNFHYPTDILAGAAIGLAVASCFMLAPMPPAILRLAGAAERDSPQLVYPLAFLFAFAAATNFDEVRAAVSALFSAI
jgi:undecaprenyl-diphosphatase